MKLLNVKNFSTLLSVIFHIALVVFIFLLYKPKKKSSNYKLIQVGFAGEIVSNSPGSPGSRGNKTSTVSSPVKQQKIIIKKKVKTRPAKKKPAEISKKKKAPKKEDTNKKVSEPSSSTNNSTGGTSTGKSNGAPGSGENSNGQNGSGPPKKGTPENEDFYHVAVDQMPVPYGGMAGIQAKVLYPPQAKANNIHGTVYIQAYIDENGRVRKVMLIKGIGYGCNQAAMRAVKESVFQPGLLNGAPVKVQMTIPVNF